MHIFIYKPEDGFILQKDLNLVLKSLSELFLKALRLNPWFKFEYLNQIQNPQILKVPERFV
jgi:hypothetical protein